MKLRVAVIGCGRITAVYKEVFQKLEEMIEVVYAVDKDRKRAEQFAGCFAGCGYSDSLEELLAVRPDIVHVLTPHFLHKQHVIDSLNAGCHVLTEKPIATTLEDAAEMCEAARISGRRLGVIFQNRYIDGIREAKKLIQEGALGRITGAWSSLNWWRPPSYYECDWKGSWEKEGGGVVIDQAIHSIDLVRYLMGCEVRSVKGHIDQRVLTRIEVEDVADAAIVFENDAVYSFYACNYFTSNSPIEIEISAEKGSIYLKGSTVRIILNGEERVILPSADALGGGRDYWGNYHYCQVRDYYQCILENKPVPFSPEDASKTLQIVLGIYEASRTNRAVEINQNLFTNE
jgi:UDP-N-acetyl-2-amino-2-deoxyglucuronate dehydrogenase